MPSSTDPVKKTKKKVPSYLQPLEHHHGHEHLAKPSVPNIKRDKLMELKIENERLRREVEDAERRVREAERKAEKL